MPAAQREHVDEAAYFLGSPPGERDPLAGDKAAAGTPVADLAALLASPPHGGHRRTFSRQGSGLSRLISKNWESDVVSGAGACCGGRLCEVSSKGLQASDLQRLVQASPLPAVLLSGRLACAALLAHSRCTACVCPLPPL